MKVVPRTPPEIFGPPLKFFSGYGPAYTDPSTDICEESSNGVDTCVTQRTCVMKKTSPDIDLWTVH